jgi:hypothetical protein
MKSSHSATRIVVAVEAQNPRKPGTQGHANWAAQTFPCTYAAYVAACPTKIAARDHFDWDRARGWVRFEDETVDQARAAYGKAPATPKVPVVEFNPDVDAYLAAKAAEAQALEEAQAKLVAAAEEKINRKGKKVA